MMAGRIGAGVDVTQVDEIRLREFCTPDRMARIAGVAQVGTHSVRFRQILEIATAPQPEG